MKRFFPAPHALLTLLLVCVGLALACAIDFDNVGPLDSDALLEADEAGDAQDILSGPAGDAEEDGIPVLAGPAVDAQEGLIASAIPLQASPDTAPGDNE